MSLGEPEHGAAAVESSRAVAQAVVIGGPVSRSEVARRLRLSPASLTRLSKPLVDLGLIVEGEATADPGHGRIARPLDVAQHLRFIGVKITLDTVYCVVTTARAAVVDRLALPLRSTDPDLVVQTIASAVTELERRHSPVFMTGVTLGGHSVDFSTVNSSRSLEWHDVPLAAMVTEATGMPTVVDNDVMALTEAQHWFGVGRGMGRFALITIGVGVGCAVVVHDQLVRRESPAQPTAGYLVLNPNGPVAADGTRGTAVAYLNSASIATAMSVGLGRVVGYEEGLRLAAAGDPVAGRVAEDAGHALGRYIAAVTTLSSVESVILSGEGIALATVAADAVAAGIAQDRPAWADPLDIHIEPMDFYEWARGGAVVAIQRFLGSYPDLPRLDLIRATT